MQPPPQASQARQGHGTYLDNLTALQPLGPMAQDPLMTTGIPNADLILPRTQMMIMLEVPSYFSFHVNNSTLECPLGSIKSGQRPSYQLSTDPSDSHLKQEPSVKTLWHDTRMMVFHVSLTVPFAILAPQYWCVNPSHQKTEKLGDVRLFFLCGLHLWWCFQIAIYLCRCLTLHDPAPCYRESAQTQCSRP